MLCGEALVTDVNTAVRVKLLPQFNPLIESDTSRFDQLASALSRSFQNEPRIRYMVPDEHVRRVVLPCFFRSVAIPSSLLCGQVSTTETMHGGALWIGPWCPVTFELMFRWAIPEIRARLGLASIRRCVKVGAHLDQVRQRLARKRHWYLMAFGVEPSKESAGLRNAMIEPVLAEADSDALPCYVETFVERDVRFYGSHGFRLEGVGRLPDGGPNFWVMIRTPRH